MNESTPETLDTVMLWRMNVNFTLRYISAFLLSLFYSRMLGKYIIIFEQNDLLGTGP